MCSLSSRQDSSAEDGGGGSGGYVPSDASESGDDDTDGGTDGDDFSDAEEGPLRCEKCKADFDADSLRECALCNELYCQDCLECGPLGEEVRRFRSTRVWFEFERR